VTLLVAGGARTTLAVGAAAVAVGALLAAGPALLVLAVGIAVVCFLAAAPTALLTAFVGASIFANYLSAWLPSAGAYPSGALLRDLLALLVLGVAAAQLSRPDDHATAAPARRRLSVFERHVLLSLFLFLGAWMLAVLVFDPEPFLGVYAIRGITLYVAAGIAAFALVERGRVSGQALGDRTLVLGLVACAIGILDSATHGAILDVLGYDPNYANVGGLAPVGEQTEFFGHDRASGGVTNAVTFAYLAAIVAAYALYRLLHDRGRRGRRVLALEASAVVAGGAACLLSLTRGALIALVLGVVVIVIAAPPSRWRVAALAAGGALVAAFLIVAGATGLGSVLEQRLTSGDLASQLSSEERQSELEYGLDVLERHPLGVGLGSFGKAASRYAELRASEVSYEIQHIPLLGLAFQLGVVGVAGLLAILLVLSRNAAANFRGGGSFALCAIIIYALSLLLGTGGEEPVSAVPLYVLLALSFASPLTPRPQETATLTGKPT